MTKDAALDLINSVGHAPREDTAISVATAGQALATIYVGEQLERIADMMAGGFKVSRAGDTFGDDHRYIEPVATEAPR